MLTFGTGRLPQQWSRRAVAIVALLALCTTPVHSQSTSLGQGAMVGEVGTDTALLQTRLTAGDTLNATGDLPGRQGEVRFAWGTDPDVLHAAAWQRTGWLQAESDHDYIVRHRLSGLRPGTEYFYYVEFPVNGVMMVSPPKSFRTLPGPDSDRAVTFCMGSCMNYNSFTQGKSNGGGPITATEWDRQQGYPAFAAMKHLQPDFFIGTGDIVYYDKPGDSPATELADLRQKWHEQFRFTRLIEFFSTTPAYWSKDDHDFRYNDADLRGDRLPSATTGIDLFREQMPIHDLGDSESPTYRTHRINRWLQLWFTEGRDYRSPNRSTDGPEKSLWGTAQRQWLQTSLQQSDAHWKIIISPTPMVGPDDASKRDNHTNLKGFRHEAEQFFNWCEEQQIDNLMVFCGDRHWQYHSIHPLGIEEFGCGALNDENSRRGVAPGSRRGTDPEGLIRQPWTYSEPSGGFLYVRVGPGDDGAGLLQIEFRDDTGRVQHAVKRQLRSTN
jgi:alkaline phosphatase D